MKQINILTENREAKPAVVALGFFDGVHKGHEEVIRQLIACSKEKQLPSVIFTFDKAPRLVLGNEFAGYITTPEEKFSILTKTGVDEVCYVPFTPAFAAITPESFVKDYLIDKLNVQTVFVGYNFCFGAYRSGNVESLRSELANYGRELVVVPQVVGDENIVISSSVIRRLIKEGNITKANDFLDRQYIFQGEVVHGDHRGTEMGFPTANLLLGNSLKCLPPNGVYACYVDTPYGTYPAIVNLGYRPTFNKETYLLEAHLCNFKGDLYGKNIRVKFLKRMRPETKFPSMGALIAQIDRDRQALLNSIS